MLAMLNGMTENYYFRKFKCGLTKKQCAELCFKNVRTITRWDNQEQEIPSECKRLMKMYAGKELYSINNEWEGWHFKRGHLVHETGLALKPHQVLTGHALLEIGASHDRKTQLKILKIARTIKNLPEHRK